MRNILTTALLPLLAGLAFGCTSTTALQSSENDDLYYASSDRTVRPEVAYTGSESVSGSEEITNPEYAAAGSGQNSITNNYNYYDNDRYSSRNYSSSRFRNYNYYSADPFYDPFYSPFGYSAAYCYNLYDPFWYPYCYPSRGLSISIGYGWGYPGGYGYYGYRPYGYGYSPYDYYGYGYRGGYGGYYQGFYDGYYAGGGGYGYGYNRQRVNYAPRTNRSNVPGNAPVNNATGRPSVPGGRVADANPNTGTVIPGSRPNRISQPGTASPSQPNQPVNNNRPQNGRVQQVSPTQNARPGRDAQQVQPENYQFQQNAQPTIEYSRPARDNATVPTQASPGGRVPADRVPAQDVTPSREVTPSRSQPSQPVQIEQPSRREQRRSQQQSQPTYQPAPQRSAPVYENSRPSRSSDNGGSYQAPSRSSSPGSSQPSGGGGRPRR
jgi:hypothetical protein